MNPWWAVICWLLWKNVLPVLVLSTLTLNKHSGVVALQHDTRGLRNTYISKDLKLCTHGSPQDRLAYSTSEMDSLCALCLWQYSGHCSHSRLQAKPCKIQFHSSKSTALIEHLNPLHAYYHTACCTSQMIYEELWVHSLFIQVVEMVPVSHQTCPWHRSQNPSSLTGLLLLGKVVTTD